MTRELIPIDTLSYHLGDANFWIETDGAIRIHFSSDDEADRCINILIPGDIAFALMNLFSMPGVRSLMNREELSRQRARHQSHLKILEHGPSA